MNEKQKEMVDAAMERLGRLYWMMDDDATYAKDLIQNVSDILYYLDDTDKFPDIIDGFLSACRK